MIIVLKSQFFYFYKTSDVPLEKRDTTIGIVLAPVRTDDAMSLQRPSAGGMLISGSESGSGSVPNLSTYGDDEYQTNICLRKRKERTEDIDYKSDFANFRTDIMKFLEEFGKTQKENLHLIREEISEIKQEIKTIKSSTENFNKRFEEINTEIKIIKSNNAITEAKFKRIESEMLQIQNKTNFESSSEKSPVSHHENLILELKDRSDREKNIIIAGIIEKNDKNFKSRQNYDHEEVNKVLSTLHKDCPNPSKTIRLGKYIANKNRPIKVYFTNTETPKVLFRNKSKLPENIKIYSDLTPSQNQYLQSIKGELQKRIEEGEKNLIIKYIKGRPTITTNQKNSKVDHNTIKNTRIN